MTYVIQYLGEYIVIRYSSSANLTKLHRIDKLSLNYASAYSFIPDLGLEGQRYSWVAAIFNFGYLFWAIVRAIYVGLLE